MRAEAERYSHGVLKGKEVGMRTVASVFGIQLSEDPYSLHSLICNVFHCRKKAVVFTSLGSFRSRLCDVYHHFFGYE